MTAASGGGKQSWVNALSLWSQNQGGWPRAGAGRRGGGVTGSGHRCPDAEPFPEAPGPQASLGSGDDYSTLSLFGSFLKEEGFSLGS